MYHLRHVRVCAKSDAPRTQNHYNQISDKIMTIDTRQVTVTFLTKTFRCHNNSFEQVPVSGLHAHEMGLDMRYILPGG